jgi:thermitase
VPGTLPSAVYVRCRLALKATLPLLLAVVFLGPSAHTSPPTSPPGQRPGAEVTTKTPRPDFALQRVEDFRGHKVASGEVLLKMREGVAPSRMSELVNRFLPGATVEQLGGPDSLWFILRAGMPVESLFRLTDPLAPFTVRREPNFIIDPTTTPNDTRFPEQWGFHNHGQCGICDDGGACGKGGADIDALRAWGLTTGSRHVVVGVVDSGIMFDHPDLYKNIWKAPAAFTITIGGKTICCAKGSYGFSAVDKSCVDSDLSDEIGHGTKVAGVLGAEGGNGQGVAGVNWHARIMVLKVMNPWHQTVGDAINGIEFAVQVKRRFPFMNLRVLNNSWEISSPVSPEESQALQEWIARADAQGMLFVAAAGNSHSDNDNVEHLPSNYDEPNIVAVAALEMHNQLWPDSNFGARKVDLAAPGSYILTTVTLIDKPFACNSGTSLAAPFVSGTTALILSKCPGIETAALKRALLDTTDPIDPVPGKEIAHGRLNAFRAIEEAIKTCGESHVAVPSAAGRGGESGRAVTGRRRKPR